ncbi:MAG: alpha/beta hydrolase [Candidatus Aminicenantia bacterium]
MIIFIFHPTLHLAADKIEGSSSIETDNYANRILQYYYFIPLKVLENKEKAHPLLACIPFLSGRGEEFVLPVFKEFAEKERFVIVSPSFVFDEKNWESRSSYQFPSLWSGEAFLRIVEKIKKDFSLKISKFYMFGFSAGAQFSLRFALWKPELCSAVSAHAGGGTVVPKKFVDVSFFVSVGRQDIKRIEIVESFYKKAKALGIDVVYKKYMGGHTLPVYQIEDSLEFFKNVRKKRGD